MKIPLLVLQISLLTFTGLAQINFESGYFINENGSKTDCFIKNIDWKYNPTQFQYKLTLNGSINEAGLETVKEFGINDGAKYLRATVNISQSSNKLGQLSEQFNPTFKKRELFLKVLIEGDANLYLYEEDEIRSFFFSVDNSPIEQLVYRKIVLSKERKREIQAENTLDIIKENNQYKQQLLLALNCNSIKSAQLENLKYKQSYLVSLFVQYNKCKNIDYKKYIKKRKLKEAINISVKPGIGYHQYSSSGFNISTSSGNDDLVFDNKTGFRIGIEISYVMPFNKNKWEIFAEPAFQYYKSEVSSNNMTETLYDRSIDIPFGIRNSIFLGDNFALFANGGLIFNIADDFYNGGFFGAGLKYNKLFGIEVRYHTRRRPLPYYVESKAKINTVSLVAGITLF